MTSGDSHRSHPQPPAPTRPDRQHPCQHHPAPPRVRRHPPHTTYLHRREWRVCRDPRRASRLATLLPESAAAEAARIDYAVTVLKWFYRVACVVGLAAVPVALLTDIDVSDAGLVGLLLCGTPGLAVMIAPSGARFRRRAVAWLGWGLLLGCATSIVAAGLGRIGADRLLPLMEAQLGFVLLGIALTAMAALALGWGAGARSPAWRVAGLPLLGLLLAAMEATGGGYHVTPVELLVGSAHGGAVATLWAAMAVFTIALLAPRPYRRGAAWLCAPIAVAAWVAAFDLHVWIEALYVCAWPGIAVSMQLIVWRARHWAAVPASLRAIAPNTLEFEHALAAAHGQALDLQRACAARQPAAVGPLVPAPRRRRLRWIRVGGHARPVLFALITMVSTALCASCTATVGDELHLASLETRAARAWRELDAMTSLDAPRGSYANDLHAKFGRRAEPRQTRVPDRRNRWDAIERYTNEVGLWTLDWHGVVQIDEIPKGREHYISDRRSELRHWHPETWERVRATKSAVPMTCAIVDAWRRADRWLTLACVRPGCEFRPGDSAAWITNAWSMLEIRWDLEQWADVAAEEFVRWLPLLDLLDTTGLHAAARECRLQSFDSLENADWRLYQGWSPELQAAIVEAANRSIDAHLRESRIRRELADHVMLHLDEVLRTYTWIDDYRRKRTLDATAILAAKRLHDLLCAVMPQMLQTGAEPPSLVIDLAHGSLAERRIVSGDLSPLNLFGRAVRAEALEIATFAVDARARVASWFKTPDPSSTGTAH